MKTRFLIISIIAALTALTQLGECNESSHEVNLAEIPEYELSSDSCSFSAPESELNLPRQTNFTNIPRCQTTAKRSTGSRTTTLHAFVKSGKILTIQSRDLSQITSDLLPMGHLAGSGHLLCLRKLII
jgi:hypothetical protein